MLYLRNPWNWMQPSALCQVPSSFFSLKLIFATASVMPFFSAWLHWCIIAAPAEIVQNYLCSSEWMIGLCTNWNHNLNIYWQRTCYAVYNMKTHKFWENTSKRHSYNDSVLVVKILKHLSLFQAGKISTEQTDCALIANTPTLIVALLKFPPVTSVWSILHFWLHVI